MKKSNFITTNGKRLVFFAAILLGAESAQAQIMPSLTTNTDAQSAGMGNVAANIESNPVNLLFSGNKKEGFALTSTNFTPHTLGTIFNINMIHQTPGDHAFLFSVGVLDCSNYNTNIKAFTPDEFYFAGQYVKKINDVAIGVTAKFGESTLSNAELKSYFAYYKALDFEIVWHQHSKDGFTAGLELKNVGPALRYEGMSSAHNLPTSLVVESGYTKIYNSGNKLTFEVDLLNPFFANNTIGFANYLKAYSHSAGSLQINTGMEYSFKIFKSNTISIRTGYCSESENTSYNCFTTGLGFGLPFINLRFAYVIPTGLNSINPQGHILQCGALINFGK